MRSYTAVAALLVVTSLKFCGSQTIDPSTVDGDTKNTWCKNQKSSCPLLCLQIPGATDSTEENTCDPVSLAYSCVCSNGQVPNASEYSQTIPYFECTEYGTQCVDACPNSNSACQSACRANNPCGAQSPTRINTSTISTSSLSAKSTGSSAASTTDGGSGGVYTGFGSSPTATSSSGSGSGSGKKNSNSAQALAIGFGRTYGLAIVLAGVCAGFMILL